MSQIPGELKYTKSHEWVRDEGDGTVTIGITDTAQELLGDLVFVELPEVDTKLDVGSECAVVESVKAASDVYSPLTGVVTAINDTLEDAPETLNQDPYGDGWLFRMKLSDTDEMARMLDADAYTDVAADVH